MQSDSEQDRWKKVGSGEKGTGEPVAQRLGTGKTLNTQAEKPTEIDGIKLHKHYETQEHLVQGPKSQELQQSRLVSEAVATEQFDNNQTGEDLMLTVQMKEADREQMESDGLDKYEGMWGMEEAPFGNQPLLDCSNRLNVQLNQKEILGNFKSEGQWKRKARMKGQGEHQQHTSMLSERKPSQGKRKQVPEENTQMPMKKQVIEAVSFLVEKENQVTISEVRETSREWSQHFK